MQELIQRLILPLEIPNSASSLTYHDIRPSKAERNMSWGFASLEVAVAIDLRRDSIQQIWREIAPRKVAFVEREELASSAEGDAESFDITGTTLPWRTKPIFEGWGKTVADLLVYQLAEGGGEEGWTCRSFAHPENRHRSLRKSHWVQEPCQSHL